MAVNIQLGTIIPTFSWITTKSRTPPLLKIGKETKSWSRGVPVTRDRTEPTSIHWDWTWASEDTLLGTRLQGHEAVEALVNSTSNPWIIGWLKVLGLRGPMWGLPTHGSVIPRVMVRQYSSWPMGGVGGIRCLELSLGPGLLCIRRAGWVPTYRTTLPFQCGERSIDTTVGQASVSSNPGPTGSTMRRCSAENWAGSETSRANRPSKCVCLLKEYGELCTNEKRGRKCVPKVELVLIKSFTKIHGSRTDEIIKHVPSTSPINYTRIYLSQ
jgi:hypothetical protein